MKKLFVVRFFLLVVMLGMVGVKGWGQTDKFFAGDGSLLNSNKWSTSPGGPFTSTFVNSDTANFGIVNGTGGGATITLSGIKATENFTLINPIGTISNKGNGIIKIDVSTGKVLDFSTQAFTGSNTAGYIKNNSGILALTGATYGGGFTVNSGTVVARGVNAMGQGGSLFINGGTIAADGSLSFSNNKFAGGIFINGNLTLGSNISPALSGADLTFGSSVILDNTTTRTITIGGSGTYKFNGIISGSGSNLTVNSTSTGILFLGSANIFSGAFLLNSGTVDLNVDSALGAVASVTVNNGAKLESSSNKLKDIINNAASITLNGNGILNLIGGSETVASLASTSTTSSLFIGDKNSNNKGSFIVGDASNTTFAGIISGTRDTAGAILTKVGSGTLTLTGDNTYTSTLGTTLVSAGTLQLNKNGTLPGSSNISIDGGTLQLSKNQTILNFTMSAGTLTVDAGQKLTIKGTYNVTGGTINNLGTIVFNGGAVTFPGTGVTVNNGTANTLNNLEIASTGIVTLSSSLIVSGSFTLTSGSLAIASNTLSLNGTLSGSGTLIGSPSSNLLVGGSGSSTVNFGQTTDSITNVLNSLTINRPSGSFTLGNKLYLLNVLTSTAGTLNTNDNLVLRSTSIAATARVALVTGFISGNVTVERYISSKRAYRFVTPQVVTNQSIQSAWMEGQHNTTTTSNINTKPGYGTHITGSGGATNGFDQTVTNNASLFTYNENTQKYEMPANTTTSGALISGKGYRLFVRGSRATDLNNNAAAPSETILRAFGTLRIGDVTFNTSSTPQLTSATGPSGYSFVGNPYASPVSWRMLQKATSRSRTIHGIRV